MSLTYFSVPPTLSLLVTTGLFSVSVTLFLFCYVCSFAFSFKKCFCFAIWVCGILVPWPGISPMPSAVKMWTTGPPENSLSCFFDFTHKWNHTLFAFLCLTYSLISSAAAAAKSLQSCPTLCDPIDCSPPGFPAPGILQARTLEWVAISFSIISTRSTHIITNGKISFFLWLNDIPLHI